MIGTVTTEAAIDPETRNESHGRISYENRGECFFLPFTTSDVEGNVTVKPGDKVSFQVQFPPVFWWILGFPPVVQGFVHREYLVISSLYMLN